MPVYGLNYGTTPALGTMPFTPYSAPTSNPNYAPMNNYTGAIMPPGSAPSTNPVGVPTGPPGVPALGTTSSIPGGATSGFDFSTFSNNLGAQIPGIESLTQAINQLNQTAQQSANAGRIPNATGLETQSSGLIGQELAGQVPQDVLNLLAQQGAERGVAMGSPGSANANAAYLRALGLTSLDQQQRGEANLTSALGRNPAAPIVDPSRFVMTPEQAARLALAQEALRLGYQPRLGTYTGPGSNPATGYIPPSSTTPNPVAPPPTFTPPPDTPPATVPNLIDPLTGSRDPYFNYNFYGGLGPSGGGPSYSLSGGGMTYPGDPSDLPWTDPYADPFNQFSPDYAGG